MYIRPIFKQWHFQGTRSQIREFIDTSLFIKSSKSISDLSIIFQNQLLDKEKKRFLTWQQLKAAKSKIKVGKKAKYFSSVEEVLLQNPKNREIKEIYQISGPNILAPLMSLIPISTNKRKKEWVLIDKKNDELETKKIIRKCNHKILTEHWSTKDNNTAQSVESLDNQLIMDQNFDINLVNNLVNSLDCNISSSKNSFWTYTDGSLIHEVNRCLWVEVGEEHELVLRKNYAKLKNWPSSTKLELIAICKELKHLNQIADLIKAKEINLELKKIKGHSNNKWNDKADVLAKKATILVQLTDINADINTRISFPLYWNEYKVEKATRPFLKKIFETWNGTNWRLTESILALEPEANNSNKKFATQLKCLLGKLPVLKTLVTRRPDIYSSDSCIAYNTSISETQDHLAECSYYKTTWQNIENTAIDLVWSKFTKEEKFRCPKHLFPQNTN
ncbi:hypothetical protein C2G38_2245007 [Gigaspora rosea]|uniref:Uncharacterized protein n=1 Tax=Gigaspora rosea TaxID=44941 RepID=A0A397VB43_9GLOM|nr:hypothetical protein C2G38_2245007 [Gigaspora rosea]